MNIASLVQGISVFFWIASIGILIFVVSSSWRGKPIAKGAVYVISAFLIALILTTLSAGLVFINPDESAVVITALQSGGIRPQALTAGLHFIVPFFESVIRYPISKQTYTMSIAANEGDVKGDDSITARTADGQQVYVDASVIYQIDPTKVVQVHIQWQDRYSDDLVRPLARGIIRDIFSQYNVEQVVTSKRVEMISEISDVLKVKMEENGLVMIDFVMRNITFTDEYAASVEQKQIAEQLAQQAAYVVQQRQQEAEQARQVAKGQADAAVIIAQGDADARIIEATAEAQALETIALALAGHPELLTYQYITKLAPGIQTMLLPSSSPFIIQLPNGAGINTQ
jgi:regulator of protease activity HflC (stomatin/prohibitin superfamily)